MDKDIEFLNKEATGMNQRIKDKPEVQEHDETVFDKIFKRFDAMSEYMKNYKPPINKVSFPNEMTVKGEVGIVDKVKAIVDNFPSIQK